MKTDQPTSSEHAIAWFRQNRFGMFIHWGIYSLRQRCEWTQMVEEIPRPEYEPLAKRFTGRNFDARAIARLAKRAGMTFACMTTKHHDGFCLFDSQLTDYTSVRRAPAKRDFIAEFADACRQEGLRVGLYYSLMDWHHPDWMALQRGNGMGHKRFLGYIHGQLRELCTNYGKIDLLFYDVPAPYEKPQEWRAAEMNAMVKRLQPGILVNDRNRLPGDFATPEQQIIASGAGRAWQTCMTLNENWAYSHGDELWKNPKLIVTYLQRIAGAGGGFLLNIGPKPDGSVPPPSLRILEAVGRWMKVNGESVYGTTDEGIIMCACGGHSTVGNRAYVHAQHWCSPEIGVGAIESKVKRVICLANGKPVKFKQTGTRLQLLDLPRKSPDRLVTVFRIEVEGQLKIRKAGVWPESITRV
jgi:alpha-L-fucosidase